HLAAAIDEDRIGVGFEEVEGFPRGQVVHDYNVRMNAPDKPFVLDPRIAAEAERLEPKVVGWRRDLHEHPELGNREVRTAKIVAEHLRRLGLDEVRENV